MAILYGTQSNGETLPVLVDQFGNLLAKGIDGPVGPPGPPGVGELPPGATDGALLGWENGELVWVTEPLPPVYVPGFRPVIYTGNGGTQSITTGFSPDLVWVKSRSETGYHALCDTLRGPGVILASNSNEAEWNDSDSQAAFKSFNSDGFTVGNSSGWLVNNTNETYIAWCWDAGDTTVTNNDGTIKNAEVRSNDNFSVVKYTGNGSVSSVGHELYKVPSFIIVKNLASAQSWCVYHKSLGETKYLFLNDSVGGDTSSTVWGDQTPTDSTFGVGTWRGTNQLDTDMVAYCWAETPGVSSFGEYDGNGRQTIATGFRPSLVIIKATGTGNWFMFDNARGASNALYANLESKEADTGAIEFLDDGFQLLFALPGVNESNETYIYAAFANPSDAAFAQRQLRRQARQEERQQNETRLR